jgi:hypothetical protein
LWGYRKGLRSVERKEERIEGFGGGRGGKRGQGEMVVGYRKGMRAVGEGRVAGLEGGGLQERIEGGRGKGGKDIGWWGEGRGDRKRKMWVKDGKRIEGVGEGGREESI